MKKDILIGSQKSKMRYPQSHGCSSLGGGPPEADLLRRSSLGRGVSWPIRVDRFTDRGQHDQARAPRLLRIGDLGI